MVNERKRFSVTGAIFLLAYLISASQWQFMNDASVPHYKHFVKHFGRAFSLLSLVIFEILNHYYRGCKSGPVSSSISNFHWKIFSPLTLCLQQNFLADSDL